MSVEQEAKSILFWKQISWRRVFVKIILVLFLYNFFLYLIDAINPIWTGYNNFRVNLVRVFFNALLIFIIFLLHKPKESSFKEFFKKLGINLKRVNISKHFRYYFIAIFALFAIYTALELTNAEYTHMLNIPSSQGIFQSFFDIAIVLITEILQVAFWEEIIFRGYLQQVIYFCFLEYFLKKEDENKSFKDDSRKAIALAIVISSLVFIFFHSASFNLYIFGLRFWNIFFGSITFGYIFYKSKDIFSTTFIHGAYNILTSIVHVVILKKMEYLKTLFENELRMRGFAENIVGNATEILSNLGKRGT